MALERVHQHLRLPAILRIGSDDRADGPCDCRDCSGGHHLDCLVARLGGPGAFARGGDVADPAIPSDL